ncbi:MAG: hypothetical protein JKX99_07755, partial [Robiginitomaculum sp.]|nr:hypothetical protein [Robiginitomaculum sp.]
MIETFGKSQVENLQQVFSNAATRTGISFDFLVKTAARESGFQSAAKAKTSSAAGMFQFIEQTWLGVVARHGAKHGLANDAALIEQNKNGRFSLTSTEHRNRILELRHDPAISTVMAAELTADNRDVLQAKLKRSPTDTELYAAHFLGAGTANTLLHAVANTPNQSAALLFPKEAAANKHVFFTTKGTARTAQELFAELGRLHGTDTPKLPQAISAAPNQTSQPTSATFGQQLTGGWVRSPLLQLSPV